MKNWKIFLIFVVLPEVQSLQGALSPEDAAQVISLATLLTPQTPPHEHDPHIYAHTNTLKELFARLIDPPPVLLSYDDAKHRLLDEAKKMDIGGDCPLDPKHSFGVTWETLVHHRLHYTEQNEHTHKQHSALEWLVPVAIHTSPSPEDLRALIFEINPTNPSASAVYNVIFSHVARKLCGLANLDLPQA